MAFQAGNLAFISGNQDGKTIRLSAFDGQSPYLFVATLDATGAKLTGSWVAGQALEGYATWLQSRRAGMGPLVPVGKEKYNWLLRFTMKRISRGAGHMDDVIGEKIRVCSTICG